MSTAATHSPNGRSPRLLDLHPTLSPAISSACSGLVKGTCSEPVTDPFPHRLPPLAYLQVAARLSELYELVFPKNPHWLTEQRVDWLNDEAVGAAIETFLQRVGQLFPIGEEIWEPSSDQFDWFLYVIPVTPVGFEIWHDDWEDFKEPAAYLLHIIHDSNVCFSSISGTDLETHYGDLLLPEHLEPQRLVETLRTLPTPTPELSALPDLIEMLNGTTGNPWLDYSESDLAEMVSYPRWDADNIAWLHTEWQEAEPIWDGVAALLNWQNEDATAIEAKLTAVHQQLLLAHEHQIAVKQ